MRAHGGWWRQTQGQREAGAWNWEGKMESHRELGGWRHRGGSARSRVGWALAVALGAFAGGGAQVDAGGTAGT